MLAKKQRLSKSDFDKVFASGKRKHSPLFQLIYQPGGDFHGAAVVGKKVYKSAVKRNRLRRQIYGALYRYQKENVLNGVFILVAKPAAAHLSQAEVAPAVQAILTAHL